MKNFLFFILLVPLFASSPVQARANGSTCWYWQDGLGMTKHANCLEHRGKQSLHVVPTHLHQIHFDGSYATIFSKKYGWMYIDKAGVVLVRHVMAMDNGADYIRHGFVRFTRNGKCGYASLDGGTTIHPQYDGCLPFSGAQAQVCNGCRIATTGEYSYYKGGRYFCIDTKGRHVSCDSK